MPSSDVIGAHYVLSQSTPGHTHRLEDIVSEAHTDELAVRREVDAMAFEGQVERLYVGEHVIVKKTEGFDPENAPDIDVADGAGWAVQGQTLNPAEYEHPDPAESAFLDPADQYSRPDTADAND